MEINSVEVVRRDKADALAAMKSEGEIDRGIAIRISDSQTAATFHRERTTASTPPASRLPAVVVESSSVDGLKEQSIDKAACGGDGGGTTTREPAASGSSRDDDDWATSCGRRESIPCSTDFFVNMEDGENLFEVLESSSEIARGDGMI